jgi:hypothetical protein
MKKNNPYKKLPKKLQETILMIIDFLIALHEHKATPETLALIARPAPTMAQLLSYLDQEQMEETIISLTILKDLGVENPTTGHLLALHTLTHSEAIKKALSLDVRETLHDMGIDTPAELIETFGTLDAIADALGYDLEKGPE